MYYYKIYEDRILSRIIKSNAPIYNGIEITEEEYRLYVPENIELDKQNEIE